MAADKKLYVKRAAFINPPAFAASAFGSDVHRRVAQGKEMWLDPVTQTLRVGAFAVPLVNIRELEFDE